jgi:hypothetical protein
MTSVSSNKCAQWIAEDIAGGDYCRAVAGPLRPQMPDPTPQGRAYNAFPLCCFSGEAAMYLVAWLTIAAVAAGLAVIILALRRGRDGDLGSVSGAWIAQHREN